MDRSAGADRRHYSTSKQVWRSLAARRHRLGLRHVFSGELVRPLVQFVVRVALDPAPLDDALLGGRVRASLRR